MLTVHPSIMLGSYLWDEERLPRDEFDTRVATLRQAMTANGWRGMIIYGDAKEHADLAWFTNFIPRMRWAMALFSSTGEPMILASMSSRDMPAMRTMTWVGNVKSGWEWKWFEEWRSGLAEDGAIGTIGLDLATPILWKQIEDSLGPAVPLVAADTLATTARAQQRPREISIIKEAAEIAAAARRAFLAAWANGFDVEGCALAAERTARDHAVQDVRTLVSRDGGRSLQPFAPGLSTKGDTALGYIAVKYLGYWADTYVNAGDSEAHRRAEGLLGTLLASIKTNEGLGGSLGEMADKLRAAGASTDHPALSGHFGRRIGHSLNEGGEIKAGVSAAFPKETAYALHVGVAADAGAAIASTLVVLRQDGKLDILDRSGGAA